MIVPVDVAFAASTASSSEMSGWTIASWSAQNPSRQVAVPRRRRGRGRHRS